SVTREPVQAAASDCSDDTISVEFANPAVVAIGNQKIAAAVEENSFRPVERCVPSGAVIAGKSCLAVTCHGGNRAGGVHSSNPVVEGIGEKEIPGGVDGDACWQIQVGVGCGPAIACKPVAGARHGCNNSGFGIDAAD